MTEQTARELLMDYLYEEISAADKEKLETYLQNHPELRQELEELQDTRALLQKAPEVESGEKLIITETKTRSFAEWWQDAKNVLPQSGWGKAALATAACLVLLLVTSAVVDLHIQSTKAGFSISFGKKVQPKTAKLSHAQTNALLHQIKKENIAILTEYADMLNKQNQQQLQEVARHFEQQRRNDLQIISKALNQYQQKTNTRLQQTHEVMDQMVQVVAATQKH